MARMARGWAAGLAMALGALMLAAPAKAADLKPWVAVAAPGLSLPFPRSERAQSVWAASACQRDCGAYCAWGQTQCLERDAQGQCLKLTDDCDRTCQRACRTSGGPLLPLDF
ncbi:MAG: hypothetical protein JSR61_02735 [Proteobacteria bacterium]|nr:hypothetical protein [Pseudomonadota bacterium]